MSDHIDLEFPLHTRWASTARAVAAAVCADLDFSVDAIDDLRLAINEAVSVLADVDVEPGDDARLTIALVPERGAVTVRCSRRGVVDPVPAEALDPIARRILDAVVDEFSVDDGAFVLVKRMPAAV